MAIQEVSIRLNTNNTQLFFPEYETLQLSPVLNDVGGVSLTASRDAKHFQDIYNTLSYSKDLSCSVYIDGVAHPELDFYLTDMSGDDVKEDGVWTFSGVTNEYRLNDAVVNPRMTFIPAPNRTYVIKAGDKYGEVIAFGYGSGAPKEAYNEFRANNPAFAGVFGDETPLDDFVGQTVIFPAASNDGETITGIYFTDKTAGAMMKFLMDEAIARGCFTDVTYNFTETHDSNGTPWPTQISVQVSAGMSYLDFAKSLAELQLAEFQMYGLQLRLYVYETLSVDRTGGNNPLIFQAGRDLSDSPRKLTVRDAGTVLVLAGNDGVFSTQASEPAFIVRGRRIERYESQGNVSDRGTLDAIAQLGLERVTAPTLEKTNGLVFGSYTPITDFNIGDWVFTDIGQGLERYRIKQWTLSIDKDRLITGSVTLNNLIAERLARLSNSINGLANGTTLAGNSIAKPVTPPGQSEDSTIPKAPAGVSGSVLFYLTPLGDSFASVAVSWVPVTENTDGSAFLDLDYYEVRWQYTNVTNDTSWKYVQDVTGGNAFFSGVLPNTIIKIQVTAVDKSGHVSAPGESLLSIGRENTPPTEPSQPVCENYLGLVRAYWDGLDKNGANMPADFKYVEVHWSIAAGFTPDDTTLSGTLNAAGYNFYDPAEYGTAYFCKLVAVDKTGNRSDPSAAGNAIPQKVVSDDLLAGAVAAANIAPFAVDSSKIADGAVGSLKLADLAVIEAKIANLAVTTGKIQDLAVSTAKIADLSVNSGKIADLAVTTAKIDNLAVNDAKIGSLSVGKLTAGTLNASVLLSGQIATASSGARCVFDSTGIKLYNSVNTQTVSMSSSNGALNVTGSGGITVTTGGSIQVVGGGTLTLSLSVGSGSNGQMAFSSANKPGDPARIYGYATGASGCGLSLLTSDMNNDGWADASVGVDPVNGVGLSAGAPLGTADYAYLEVRRSSGLGYVHLVSGLHTWTFRANADGSAPRLMTSRGPSWIVAADQWWATMNGSTTQFISITASGFNQGSARETKTNIVDIPFDSLNVVKNVQVSQWNYKPEFANDHDRPRIGPMVEDLPPELMIESEAGKQVDLLSMIGTVWDAVAKLALQVDVLEGNHT